MAQDFSPSQRVADLLLQKQGSTLRDWLTDRRAQGLSYEEIGRELYMATDGEVSVSYQTIKRWLLEMGIIEEATA